ncbi:MAG: hypothetical protein H0V83_15960 [Rubrobacter sp.]|nr:hypothetical protein [Rubrobacter sp.]
MRGRYMMRGAGFGHGRWGHHGGYGHHGHKHHSRDHFFGLDAERMSPRSQVAAASSVLVPVALGAIFVAAFVPQMFWLIFVFGWMIFPAFGLLVRGIAGMSQIPASKPARATVQDGERELLMALQRNGELTAVGVASETSLSVTEADRRLKELAEGGHLDVRVHGGGIFYALWNSDTGDDLTESDNGPRPELGAGSR